METLLAGITDIRDIGHMPTYTNLNDLIQVLHGLHMSEILGYDDDDDGADKAGPNDIDTSRMASTAKHDDYIHSTATSTM